MTVCKTQCKAGEWENSLDGDDRAALPVFLDSGDSMASLHALFAEEAGLDVGLTTWKDHIRHRCGCDS